MENVTITKYRIIQRGLTFGNAFDIINDTAKNKLKHPEYLATYGMRLPSWSPDVVIRVQYPDENSKMTAPYLYVESRFGRVPWKDDVNNKKKQEKKDDNSVSVNFNGKLFKEATLLYENDLLSKILFDND